jgi:beta-lactamase class A
VGRLGLKSAWLYKKIGKPPPKPMPADQKRFGLGKTTAAEMATLLTRIVTCRLGEGDDPPTESDLSICSITLHMLRSPTRPARSTPCATMSPPSRPRTDW